MSNRTIQTDVLVVGSGAIGATYARLLATPERKVVMIEAGAQLTAPPGNHLQNAYVFQVQPNISLGAMYSQNILASIPNVPYEVDRERDFFKPPTYRTNFSNPRQNPNVNMPNAAEVNMVGGAFGLSSGFSPTPPDFERTKLIPAAEWDVMLPLAHRLFDTSTDAFEPSAVSRALKKVLKEKVDLTVENVPMAAQKQWHDDLIWFVNWSGADTILGPLVDESNPRSKTFQLLSEHRADRLVWKGGRVHHAEVRNLATNDTLEIHAEIFIIAGNAFLTPRLLWQSGIRPQALGRFLTENSIVTVSVNLNHTVIEALRSDSDNPARDWTIPITHYDPSPKIGFAPTEEKPWIGHINRTARYIYLSDPETDTRLSLDMTWYGTIDPNPDNRVLFEADLSDRFGQPQMTFEYELDKNDAMLAERMLTDLSEVSTAIGDYIPIQTSAQSAAGIVGPMIQPPGTSFHWMGTHRMGAQDDDTSVVDSNSKVWAFENLYLGGGGVIPNKVATNATIVSAAIAVKSAASIAGRSLQDLAEDLDADDS